MLAPGPTSGISGSGGHSGLRGEQGPCNLEEGLQCVYLRNAARRGVGAGTLVRRGWDSEALDTLTCSIPRRQFKPVGFLPVEGYADMET